MESIQESEKIQIKIKDKFTKMKIVTIIACIILGTLLHFTYEWFGNNILIGSFSAVNESVWEHLKLTFFPMLIMSIIEYFLLKNISNNFIESKAIGIFTAISFIVVTFFTYTGMLGTNFIIFDILIFMFSIILGEWISYRLMKRPNESTLISKILASLIIIILLICFIVCTYWTPKVNLFKDPITGTYGIK